MKTIKRLFRSVKSQRDIRLIRKIYAILTIPIFLVQMTSFNLFLMMPGKALAEDAVAVEQSAPASEVPLAGQAAPKEESQALAPAPEPKNIPAPSVGPTQAPVTLELPIEPNNPFPEVTTPATETPTVSDVPTTPSIDPVPATIERPALEPSASSADVSVDTKTWATDGNKSTTNAVVELGKTYTAPQNDQVTVTFTELPANAGKLSIEEITLSDEQVATLHALSNKAYDITSDMTDGTFKYDLTLPKPADQKKVEIKFAEDTAGLENADTVAKSDVTTENTSVNATLDHFTIFVVTGVNNTGSCTGASVGLPDGTTACYTTIQAAIDAAGPDETINVATGTYNLTSRIDVNKAVSIVGDVTTPSNVVINAPVAGGTQHGQNSVFMITSSDVTVRGFKIQGALHTGVAQNAGIYVDDPRLVANPGLSNITISDNEVTNNGYGIFVHNIKNSTISNNKVYSNKSTATVGMEYDAGTGIVVYGRAEDSSHTYNLTIDDNDVYSNETDGIRVDVSSSVGASDWINDLAITISNNTVYDNGRTILGADKYIGIKSSGMSKGVTVSGNEIYGHAMSAVPSASNQSSGIWIAASNDWEINNNNTHDNTNGIYFRASTAVAGSGSHTISNNTIHANVRGVSIDDGTEAVANNKNSIYSNSSTAFSGIGFAPYGVYNSGSGALDATNNWWGSTCPTFSSPLISSNVTHTTWYIDAGKTTLNSTIDSIFDNVSTALASQGVVSNIGDVTTCNYTGFSNLAFEKRTNIADPATALGKITFSSALNLSLTETQTFLQNLGDVMEQSNGRIALDVSTATAFVEKGAILEMYNIASPIDATKIIARDESDNILSGVVSGFSQTGSTVFFTAAHFTQFDIDTDAPTKPVATPGAGDYTSDQSVTLSSTDTLSGIDKIYYTTDGTTPNKTKTEYISAIPVDKDITIKAIAYDKAGNASGILTAVYGIAPVISFEASSSSQESGAVITWTTDDPATSRVVYDTVSHPVLGEAPNYGYAFSTVETDSSPKVTSHSVTLTGLSDDFTYYYRVVSHGSPEIASSTEYSFTTKTTIHGEGSNSNRNHGGGGSNGTGGSNVLLALLTGTTNQSPISAVQGATNPSTANEGSISQGAENPSVAGLTTETACKNLIPSYVWILLAILYAVMMLLHLFLDIADTNKLRWFWQVVGTAVAYEVWNYFDNCRLHGWFPYLVIVGGIVIYLIYLVAFETFKKRKNLA